MSEEESPRANSLDISKARKRDSTVPTRNDTPPSPSHSSHWQAEPVPLAPSPAVRTALKAYDVALILVPVLLIVKAVLCVVAHHVDRDALGPHVNEASNLTRYLIQFNDQLVTLFTIMFVMIMAGLVRRIALWKAQKGATIAELEQFQNSTTLPGTIQTAWSLRSFGLTSISLIFAWSWYYLGSQAMQREYTFQNSGKYSDFPIALLSSSGPSFFGQNNTLSMTNVDLNNINAQFTQACLAKRQQPYDQNGAAMVPIYGQTTSLSYYPFVPDSLGWQDSSEYTKMVYSNLVGSVPIGPPIKIGTSNIATQSYSVLGDYSYNTSYVVANCTFPTIVSSSKFPSEVPETLGVSFNMTPASSSTVHGSSPRTFNLWSWYNTTTTFHSLCALSTDHVEVSVSCTALGCTVVRIRPTAGIPIARSYHTPFDSDDFASTFFNNMMLSSGIPTDSSSSTVLSLNTGMSTFVENFENIYQFLYQGARPQGYASDLTAGMSQVINTYLTASQQQAHLTSSISSPSTLPNPSNLPTTSSDSAAYIRTTIRGAPHLPQYSISLPWLIIDFISTVTLLLASVFSTILRHRTLAPDILGYVSSMTRDNPRLAAVVPDGGSAWSGMERARRLGRVRVKIADVGVDAIEEGGGQVPAVGGVGRVALTHATPAHSIGVVPGVDERIPARANSRATRPPSSLPKRTTSIRAAGSTAAGTSASEGHRDVSGSSALSGSTAATVVEDDEGKSIDGNVVELVDLDKNRKYV